MRKYKSVSQRYRDALTRVSWQDFERLLASYYMSEGYRVDHVGTAASGTQFDGGIDLKLHRDTEYIVVQCKHWNMQQVTHNTVHELLGVMLTQGATGAIVVTSGEFTRAAKSAAAKESRVQLIDGAALRQMLGPLVDAFPPTQSGDADFGDLTITERESNGPASYRPRPARLRRMRNPLPSMAFAVIAALIAFYVIRQAIDTVARNTSAPPSAVIREVPPVHRSFSSSIPLRPAQSQHSSDQQMQMSDAELKEWKRKNAESMKILEKTTPEMRLR